MTSTIPSIIPENEHERLAAVHRLRILDTPADGAFDRIARIASSALDMPIAIVSIVDTDRIWFKAAHGLDGVSQIGREPGLCASAILQDDTWVVNAADQDPRSLANPLVAGEFGLRFYAGVPLRLRDGHSLGTLCVIDREAREFTAAQVAILEDLAALVVDELELRLAARNQARHVRELNDDVVQELAQLKLGLEVGMGDHIALASTALEASKRILAELVADAPDLTRSGPAGPARLHAVHP